MRASASDSRTRLSSCLGVAVITCTRHHVGPGSSHSSSSSSAIFSLLSERSCKCGAASVQQCFILKCNVMHANQGVAYCGLAITIHLQLMMAGLDGLNRRLRRPHLTRGASSAHVLVALHQFAGCSLCQVRVALSPRIRDVVSELVQCVWRLAHLIWSEISLHAVQEVVFAKCAKKARALAYARKALPIAFSGR